MPAIIAWVVAGLARIVATRIGMWIVSGLVFLGLELGTQKVVLGPVLTQLQSVSSGLAGDAAGWLAFFNVDRYLSIIISAYGAAAAKGVILRKRGGS